MNRRQLFKSIGALTLAPLAIPLSKVIGEEKKEECLFDAERINKRISEISELENRGYFIDETRGHVFKFTPGNRILSLAANKIIA